MDAVADSGGELNLSAAIAEVTLSITTRALFGMDHRHFIEHCTAVGSVLDEASSVLPGAAAGAGPRDALYRQLRHVSASAPEHHCPALSARTSDPERRRGALPADRPRKPPPKRKEAMTTTSPQKTDIAAAVHAPIADYTKLPVDQITPDRALDDLGLDSLGALELILTCEVEFGIVALDDTEMEVHTVGDAIAFIEAKLR